MATFCRSCGVPAESPGSSGACVACGASLASPAAPTNVGQLVQVRTTFGARLAVVVSEAGRDLHVIDDKGRPRLVAAAKAIPVSRAFTARSAGYRFQLASDMLEFSSVRFGLINRRDATIAEVGQARAFLDDVTVAGDVTSVGAVKVVSATELLWAQMWAHHNAGRCESAIDAALALPRGRYPDVVGVIGANWTLARRVAGDAALLGLLRAQLDSKLASVMRAVLGDEAAIASIETTLSELAAEPVPGVEIDDASTSRIGTALTGRALRVDDSNGAAAATAALALRRPIEGDPSRLLGLPMACLDDLIDGGLVSRELAHRARHHQDPDAARICARLVPELLSDHEVRSVGHTEEAARRAAARGKDLPDGAGERWRSLAAASRGDVKALIGMMDTFEGVRRERAESLARMLTGGPVDTRLIADRSVWPAIATIFEARPELREEPGLSAVAEWAALSEADERLSQWDWAGAAESARACLRTSRSAGITDEALNILAVALMEARQEDAARAAIGQTLSRSNQSLLVNRALLLKDQDPQRAASDLLELVGWEPRPPTWVNAAQEVLNHWFRLDDEESSLLEPRLIALGRKITSGPSPEGLHNQYAMFLTFRDSDWLANPSNTSSSPYAGGVQHRYLVARAESGSGASEVLANELSRGTPSDEDWQWARREADRMASWAIDQLTTDVGSFGAALWAMNLVDAGIEFEPREAVLLRAFAAGGICDHFYTEDQDFVPNEWVWNRLADAETIARGTNESDQEFLMAMVGYAAQSYAFCASRGWRRDCDAIVDTFNQMVETLGGLRSSQINRTAVQESLAAMRAALVRIAEEMSAVRRLIAPDPDFTLLDAMDVHVARLRSTIDGFRA